MIKSRQYELADELSKYFPMSSEDLINGLRVMALYNMDANDVMQLMKKNNELVQDNERLKFVIDQYRKDFHERN